MVIPCQEFRPLGCMYFLIATRIWAVGVLRVKSSWITPIKYWHSKGSNCCKFFSSQTNNSSLVTVRLCKFKYHTEHIAMDWFNEFFWLQLVKSFNFGWNCSNLWVCGFSLMISIKKITMHFNLRCSDEVPSMSKIYLFENH